MRLGHVGPQPHCLLIADAGVFEAVLFADDEAEVDAGGDVIRLKFDAAAVGGLGLGVLALLRQRVAEQELALGVARLDLQRLAEAGGGLGQAPAGLAQLASASQAPAARESVRRMPR
jgi:hypothetical protein